LLLGQPKKIRLIIYLILVLSLFYFLYLVRSLLFSFILAVVITYILNPTVSAIERKGTPRIWSIVLVYLAVFFIATGIVIYGVPQIVEQLNCLAETIPLYAAQVHDIIESLHTSYIYLGIPDWMKQIIDERIYWLEESLLQIVRNTVDGLINTAGYVFQILLAPILAFYILKDLHLLKEKIVSILPVEWKKDLVNLFKELDHVLGSFIRGYLLVAAIVGVLTVLAMALLGMEFALMVGIFVGLMELIPYFGPVIGAVPAVALALLESKWMAIKVTIAFIVIHQLEGYIISPKILGDKVGLHPLVVILSLLVGGKFYGLFGILLAVPVTAMLRVVVRFIFLRMQSVNL